MKKLFFIAQLLLFGFLFTSATFINNPSSVKGEVIWEGTGCDYYIIETNQWFVLVELYSGTLSKYDIVEGELHSFNFKVLTNKSRSNREVKVYIENFWSSKNSCYKWLEEHDKCGL